MQLGSVNLLKFISIEGKVFVAKHRPFIVDGILVILYFYKDNFVPVYYEGNKICCDQVILGQDRLLVWYVSQIG
jgi:hypothetical protein